MNKRYIFIIRQILNIVFMLMALGGVAVYLLDKQSNTGLFIIMFAVVVKFAESILRMLNKEIDR